MPSVRRCTAVALFIVGCLIPLLAGADPKKGGDAEAALGATAEEYWVKRLIEHDYKFTYEMEMEKDTIPFSDYLEKVKAGERFKYSSIKTTEVIIDGDKGIVLLTVECSGPPFPKFMKQMLQDLWLYRSDQWKHKFTDK